jgi:N-methylhydantoinase A
LLDKLDAGLVDALRKEMRAAATAALEAQGYRADTLRFADQIDLRLEGQDAALQIPFSGAFDRAALRPAFIAAYGDTYGYTPTDAVEAVALRLHTTAHASNPLDFTALKAAPATSASAAGRRKVHFGRDKAIDTPILPRETVTAEIAGPLIIEGADTTIVIPPGARVVPDATGSLVATLEIAA